MTDKEMWCKNCCNFDWEKADLEGDAPCKINGALVSGEVFNEKCVFRNVQAEIIKDRGDPNYCDDVYETGFARGFLTAHPFYQHFEYKEDVEHEDRYYVEYPDGLRMIFENGKYAGHYNCTPQSDIDNAKKSFVNHVDNIELPEKAQIISHLFDKLDGINTVGWKFSYKGEIYGNYIELNGADTELIDSAKEGCVDRICEVLADLIKKELKLISEDE